MKNKLHLLCSKQLFTNIKEYMPMILFSFYNDYFFVTTSDSVYVTEYC